MDAFVSSTLLVALGEIGDKTQLLSLALVCRFRKPWPILAGVVVATLVNHGLSVWFGDWLADAIPADWLTWILGGSFIALGLWMLIPDKDEGVDESVRFGPFLTSLILFFIAEIGDKTQVATVLLATRYEPLWQVIAGTTIGMLLANLPVVWLGHRFADRLPLKLARSLAALVFFALALWVAWRGVG